MTLAVELTSVPAWAVTPACPDAERNCVSTIHPLDGPGHDRAAHVLVSLLIGARQLGRSGVDLKDGSGDAVLGSDGGVLRRGDDALR